MRRSEFMLGGEDFKDLKASQLMEADVVACRPENTWKQISDLMSHGGFGDVPIIDNDKTLLGIITEFDLLKVLMEDKDVKNITAGDIMTENVVSVSEATNSVEIINILETKHLVRVPVVRNGILVGVVARRDILFAFLQSSHRPPGVF
ncbi:MAG: cyclic nucleotide-binding/CBS domain-containing protein [Candidatus Scalinduaceae bacterium]